MRILLRVFVLGLCANLSAVTYHVDGGKADDSGDGLSWANAKKTLQAAVALAGSGDEIWVKAGTYKPNDLTGTTDRAQFFSMKDGVEIFGGFAGAETLRGERDPAANMTVLSGDLDGDDVVSGSGGTLSIANNGENVYQVIRHTTGTVGATAVLDGFTISGGNANGGAGWNVGGGMFNQASSPTVKSCIFRHNSATQGGAIYCDGGSTAAFWDSQISANYASSLGGGFLHNNASPNLFRCLLTGNRAASHGGAIYLSNGGTVTLTDSTVSGNHAADQGGAVWNGSSTLTLSRCTLSGNTSGSVGVIRCESATANLTNVTVHGNTTGGDVLYFNFSTLNLLNSTLTANLGGPVFYYRFSGLNLTNAIVWGNDGSHGVWGYSYGGGSTTSHSLVQGGADGTGNLDADPLLGALRDNGGEVWTCALLNGSPAIDAGTSAGAPATDARGQARDANVDMGAYESSGALAVPVIHVRHDAAGANDGTSWADAYTSLSDALATSEQMAEVWVAAGTYLPDTGTDFDGSGAVDPRERHFQLRNGLAVYGGFAGTETLRGERDPAANVTVLSGDLAGDDVVTGGGGTLSIANNGENAYHVICQPLTGTLNGEVVLDGFGDGGQREPWLGAAQLRRGHALPERVRPPGRELPVHRQQRRPRRRPVPGPELERRVHELHR